LDEGSSGLGTGEAFPMEIFLGEGGGKHLAEKGGGHLNRGGGGGGENQPSGGTKLVSLERGRTFFSEARKKVRDQSIRKREVPRGEKEHYFLGGKGGSDTGSPR